MRIRLRSVAWALFAMAAGFLAARLIVPLPGPETPPLPDVEISRLSFTSLDGSAVPLTQWQGEVLLLNFWATWCPPCREEMPLFQQMREAYRARGFEVLGVAVEDQAEKVRAFRSDNGITYPILLSGPDAPQLMRRLGNTIGALPYSLLVDRKGKVVRSKIGLLSSKELESWIKHELRRIND